MARRQSCTSSTCAPGATAMLTDTAIWPASCSGSTTCPGWAWTAIWLSPTMPSPDEDWGYDVSDYTGVHPELGTHRRSGRPDRRGGERGIRVLLDLVPNHTSSAHPWFVEPPAGPGQRAPRLLRVGRRQPRRRAAEQLAGCNRHAGLAVGRCHRPVLPAQLPGRRSPTSTGGSPAVHDEFRDILRFWFDRGVAGFRIDVAHGLYKDAQLRDNPPLPPGQRRTGRPLRASGRCTTPTGRRRTACTATGASSPTATGAAAAARRDLGARRRRGWRSFYGSDDELHLPSTSRSRSRTSAAAAAGRRNARDR